MDHSLSVRAVGISLICGGLLVVGVCRAAAAAVPELGVSSGPWGYWVDLGANWVPDTEATPSTGLKGPGGEVDFDTGLRLDAGVGYSVTRWFQVGLATGYSQNGLRSLLGWDVTDGSLEQVPFQLEFRVAHTLGERLEVFAGGGGGGVYVRSGSGSSAPIWSGGESSGVGWGYSLSAGGTYPVWRQVRVGAAYRYAVTDGGEWVLQFNDGSRHTLDVNPLRNQGVVLFFQAIF